jgi:hypothetical protein
MSIDIFFVLPIDKSDIRLYIIFDIKLYQKFRRDVVLVFRPSMKSAGVRDSKKGTAGGMIFYLIIL